MKGRSNECGGCEGGREGWRLEDLTNKVGGSYSAHSAHAAH